MFLDDLKEDCRALYDLLDRTPTHTESAKHYESREDYEVRLEKAKAYTAELKRYERILYMEDTDEIENDVKAMQAFGELSKAVYADKGAMDALQDIAPKVADKVAHYSQAMDKNIAQYQKKLAQALEEGQERSY